jgi:hypothetical protein
MFFDEEIRHPQLNDRLFIEEGGYRELAYLHKMFQEFSSYAEGYQIGALKLIDTLDLTRNDKDFLIYPIVFLIRHYVELRLKEVIQGLNFCIGQTKDFPTGHNIDFLWKDFKKKYEIIGESLNYDRFTFMDSIINEIHLFDPISMSFRYPVDKEGNKIQKLNNINIVNLRETFVRLTFFMDGIGMQISHYVDITPDLYEDFYNEYY